MGLRQKIGILKIDDVIRVSLLAPPDDVVKRAKVNEFLERHKERVERVRQQLIREGLF
ncbi:MAG: hypothetical protein RTU92_14730 [Candidatus Thorarchaeota archaeon]